MDGSGNVDPGTHATSVDILGISKRLQRLPNWKSDIEEIRDRMMKESRKQGMSKADAQAWTYSELDRLYPPAETTDRRAKIAARCGFAGGWRSRSRRRAGAA